MRVRAGARVTTDNKRVHNQKAKREKEAGGTKRVKKNQAILGKKHGRRGGRERQTKRG